MGTKSLLIELLVEEIPPKALKTLGVSFAAVLAESLKAQGLASEHSALTAFASPRRLAAHLSMVRRQATDREISHKLMPVGIGLNAEGNPTPALLKKLTALGVDASVLPQLRRGVDGKVQALFFDSLVVGTSLIEGLQLALDEALAKLPVPKLMQYQLADGWTSVNFVRPAHGLVALWGAEVLPVQALGLSASRQTQGHRFEALISPVVIQDADHYARQMEEQGAVMASFAARRAEIVRQLSAAASQEGLQPIDDAALLDEVTALVERPHVLLCQFEPEYLDVPPECLILTMKANQKYFPLLAPSGKLTNKFLVVSNISPTDSSRVIEGNERVVRPRLADAKFFFDQDRKQTLAARVAGLDKVVYHGKLGTQGQRVQRVQAIAKHIAQQIGGDALAAQVDRAAQLAKADLLTDMVGEFPELQGIMGCYYALHEGEPDEVAFAIEDHYKPRFAGDVLPRSTTGVVLALADKLETLVGLFGVGQAPSGDKDPFALRRHALGVVRLIVEQDLPLGLSTLIDIACNVMPESARSDGHQTRLFVLERATSYFEEQGFDARAIASVLGPHGPMFPLGQLLAIVREATRFIGSAEGRVLAEANKRITNILKKSGAEISFGVSPHALTEAPDESMFQHDEERNLFAALSSAGEDALKLRQAKKFAEALAALVPLSEPIKVFFDKVMVNVDQPEIRDNRIVLLQHARAYMNQVADLTLMAG